MIANNYEEIMGEDRRDAGLLRIFEYNFICFGMITDR